MTGVEPVGPGWLSEADVAVLTGAPVGLVSSWAHRYAQPLCRSDGRCWLRPADVNLIRVALAACASDEHPERVSEVVAAWTALGLPDSWAGWLLVTGEGGLLADPEPPDVLHESDRSFLIWLGPPVAYRGTGTALAAAELAYGIRFGHLTRLDVARTLRRGAGGVRGNREPVDVGPDVLPAFATIRRLAALVEGDRGWDELTDAQICWISEMILALRS